MFRSRSENLRSVFILLFLNVAFFLLEHQDSEKYARLFSFDWAAVKAGQWWRVATWQFTQAGDGWMEALALFISLVLLYLMGSALEEEWGTFHFVMLFVLSTGTSAGVAAWLGIPLLNSYFIYFTLLFVYASAFPQQRFFDPIPVPVRLIAAFVLAALVYGVVNRGGPNIAAFAGSAVAYLYYLSSRIRIRFITVEEEQARESDVPPVRIDTTAIHNAARFVAIRQAMTRRSASEVDRLIAQSEREITAGVNICPPADYKPDATDGYCIRCEGFAECSVRYLKMNRPPAVPDAAPVSSAITP